MRIAIFGGTFDPVHNAHLHIAREAMAQAGLDQVLFIPAAHPPHKADSMCAPYEHRYRMVELACQGEARFVPSRIEAGSERSYSILTIERLKARQPGDEFLFLIGADAFAEIGTWRRWREVIAAVSFIVVTRPGHRYETPEGACVTSLETVALPVSSSGIREDLSAGRAPSELPAEVFDYIRAHRLYGFPG